MINCISKWRCWRLFSKKRSRDLTRGHMRSQISNKSKISVFFKNRQRIPENEAYERETEEVLVNHPTLGKSTTSSETRSSEIMITLKLRAKREAKRSWSSYHLERNERLKGLSKPNSSSEARGQGVLVNLLPRAQREAKGSLWIYHLERSERLRHLG